MDSPRIRLYSREDYPEVIELWLKAGLILSYSDNKDEINKFADFNTSSFFILELKNEIIGTVIAAKDGRRGYIHHLAIHPRYQKNGFGKQLMEVAEAFYRKDGIIKIHLMVEKENIGVVNYYLAQNWIVRDDLILMSKTLYDGEFESS